MKIKPRSAMKSPRGKRTTGRLGQLNKFYRVRRRELRQFRSYDRAEEAA